MKKFFLEQELSENEMKYEFSKFHVFPIPFERTVSYGKGTSRGPEVIIDASNQLERIHDGPCDYGIYTHSQLNCSLSFDNIFKNIEDIICQITSKDKIPVSLGGEHTITYGIIKGLKRNYLNLKKDFGVIQFDAHADLRKEYNGNKHSHATVMYKLIQEDVKIFQVGVRTQAKEEIDLRNKLGIRMLSVCDYRNNCNIELPSDFPNNVYVTFDTDCLDPSIMPATGTPVPNGFYYNEVFQVLKKLIKDRKLIGFDYVEFAPIKKFHAYDFISANIIHDMMKLCLKM